MRRLLTVLIVFLIIFPIAFVDGQGFLGGTTEINGEPVIGQTVIYLNGPLQPPTPIAVTAHAIYKFTPNRIDPFKVVWSKWFDIPKGLNVTGGQSLAPRSNTTSVITREGENYLITENQDHDVVARKLGRPAALTSYQDRKIKGYSWE